MKLLLPLDICNVNGLRCFVESASDLDLLLRKRSGLLLIIQLVHRLIGGIDENILPSRFHAGTNAILNSLSIMPLHHQFVGVSFCAVSVRDLATEAAALLGRKG